MRRELCSRRVGACVVVALLTAFAALFGPPSKPAKGSGQTCWYLALSPCSQCGTPRPECSTVACVPYYPPPFTQYYCPPGTWESKRKVSEKTGVNGCYTRSWGSMGCTTVGGTTLWCVANNDCDTTNICQNVPGVGRFCTSLGETPNSPLCGITNASLTGGSCPNEG